MAATLTKPIPVPAESLLLTPTPSASGSKSEGNSSDKSPRRSLTEPVPELERKGFKRLIICCDGTWQDGLSARKDKYTNVLRLARAINYEDARSKPSIPQIVFYQSGVGTDNNLHSKYIDGATGAALADKVEEAYGFIAHNYNPGDEVFLFGFSRGAYTARMVSMFIGEIGVLDRREMNNFADIFGWFQELGEAKGDEKAKLKGKLAKWREPGAPGKRRVDVDRDTFTVKCLAVWDTVGALGLPKEFTLFNTKTIKLFGFHDRKLGDHVEHAFHAMGLHEMRADFNISKLEQTETGRAKKQVLKQCWFSGCHTDIGGGYEHHDLSDISLAWIAGQVESLLSLDTTHLGSHFEPVAEWGKQQPHDSATGIFLFANKAERDLPKAPNDPETQEFVHPSVLEQQKLSPALKKLLAAHPNIVCPLSQLEEQFKTIWKYNPDSPQTKKYAEESQKVAGGKKISLMEWLKICVGSISRTAQFFQLRVRKKITTSEDGSTTVVDVAATATVINSPLSFTKSA